jgi:leucyl aminopeptidase (aminopeptidase T)
MSETTDVSTSLKPEFLVVVDKIYREMCNLQPGTKVLIISDSRTPRHVISVFMGMAMSMGAQVSVSENPMPPPPTLQPGYEWNPMVKAAAREADLILDLAVGYADFMAEAVERGARIMSPGDGTGGHHIEDTLIRTMLAADIHALRKEANAIADLFTGATTLRMTSDEGTDFELDLSGLEGISSDEFLWDPDKKKHTGTWAALPPAAPGVVIPKGRGNGVMAVDGFLLYEPAYDHERPTGPVFLTFRNGKIVEVSGERLFAGRLRHWLEAQPNDSAAYGPVHLNLGLNPRAMLTQHPEFEKLRGTVCCGIGDSSLLTRMWHGSHLEANVSHMHWDILLMRPNLYLDGTAICESGFIVFRQDPEVSGPSGRA